MANIEKISSVVQNEKIVEKINELADGVNSSLKEAPVLSVNGQTGEVQITSVENADNADTLGGKSSSEFATAEQGSKADTALQAGDVTKETVGLENVANERQYSSENPPPYPVVSVAGKTGAVSLVKNDVGLKNVDNTADLDKPVSTAQSVAIADAKKAGTDALAVANGKYTKPNDGIPKADLDVGVQASLSKADTALQKAPVTSVNGATGNVQIDVPTKLSELTNDKGFITATVNNLTNYYTKTLTYTKTEVDNLLSAIPKFGVSVVDSLPTTGISSTTVYLIPNTAPDDSNLYDEYIYVLGKWEKLGTAKIDLSNYVTVTQLNSALASYATKTEVGAKYTKPSTGIPKSDLASAVQTSLNKADSALQAESDPTVPAWAKQPNKPSYTKSEVGLSNVANERQYSANNPPPYPVTSVNGEKGAVQITAAKIGALTSVPISTATAIGGVKSSTTGTTSGRDYKVQVNTDGTMKVNVPWENTQPNLSPYAKGAASSTDNAIARFDGTTGKIIQNSSATVNDNGDIKGNYLEGTWLKTTATTAVTTTQKVATIDDSGWVYYITPENLKTVLGVRDTNTTYSFSNGSDGSFTVTPSGGQAQKVSIGTPAAATKATQDGNGNNIANTYLKTSAEILTSKQWINNKAWGAAIGASYSYNGKTYELRTLNSNIVSVMYWSIAITGKVVTITMTGEMPALPSNGYYPLLSGLPKARAFARGGINDSMGTTSEASLYVEDDKFGIQCLGSSFSKRYVFGTVTYICE